jgi:hypothetical protein
MADTKITALAAITTVDPAADVLPIVDISDTSMAASGTTKKITSNQILGAGGTATLASATITGDLTVRTSKLKVTSIGVGAGTATPSAILHSTGTSSYDALTLDTDSAGTYCIQNWKVNGVQKAQAFIDVADDSLLIRTNTATGPLKFGCNSILQHRIDPLGIFTWYDGAGGTRMTLNSTGLGVGVTPSAARLEVGGQDGTQFYIRSTGTTPSKIRGFTNAAEAGVIGFLNGGGIYFDISGERARLDASGNLLVGTTSSLRNTAHSFKATGASTSYWAAAFQQDGTTSGGRCISLDLPNTNSSSSLFVYATNSSGYAFGVLGNGSLENATGSYGTISDLRLKENISDARNYLADLLKLRVVKYSLKSEASAVATKIGLIAQEVEQVFPTLVETNTEDAKSIKTTVLIPMLLKAIQELAAEVNALKNA